MKTEEQTLPTDIFCLINNTIRKKRDKTEIKNDFIKFSTYLNENKINLCQVRSLNNHCLLGTFFFMKSDFCQFLPELLKYSDLKKVPDSVINPWVGAALSLNPKIIKTLGKYDKTGINQTYSSTGFGTGNALGIMTAQFRRDNLEKIERSAYGLPSYRIKEKALTSFSNNPLTLMLSLDADVNQFTTDDMQHEKHNASYILDDFKSFNELYASILTLYLQHNFDYNQKYNFKNGDNYIQHLLRSEMLHMDKVIDLFILHAPVDMHYKNDNGLNVMDMVEQFSRNQLVKTKMEQMFLNSKVEHVADQFSSIKKARI